MCSLVAAGSNLVTAPRSRARPTCASPPGKVEPPFMAGTAAASHEIRCHGCSGRRRPVLGRLMLGAQMGGRCSLATSSSYLQRRDLELLDPQRWMVTRPSPPPLPPRRPRAHRSRRAPSRSAPAAPARGGPAGGEARDVRRLSAGAAWPRRERLIDHGHRANGPDPLSATRPRATSAMPGPARPHRRHLRQPFPATRPRPQTDYRFRVRLSRKCPKSPPAP